MRRFRWCGWAVVLGLGLVGGAADDFREPEVVEYRMNQRPRVLPRQGRSGEELREALRIHARLPLLNGWLMYHDPKWDSCNLRYVGICYRAMPPPSPEFTEQLQEFTRRFAGIARGVLLIHREKMSVATAYRLAILPVEPQVPFGEWYGYARSLSPEWASRYLSYDESTRKKTLVCNTFISFCGYLAFRDRELYRLRAKLGREPGREELLAALRLQLESCDMKLPPEYADLRPVVIKEAAETLADLPTLPEFQSVIAAIKADYRIPEAPFATPWTEFSGKP